MGVLRALAACMLVGLAVLELSPAARATDAFPTTNDQATNLGVARWFYWGQTADQVGALANQNNARLTDVRVEDPSVPTFAVTMVGNTGPYGSAWWWYFGVDANTVGNLLTQNNARLTSIDPYWTSAGLRFAVVMVPNTGAQNRAWWWYFGVDSGTVANLLNQNNARPVALRPYMDSGQRVFAVIMVSNTGVDSKAWEWWIQQSPDFIGGKTTSDQMRVIAVAPDPLGGWDAILVANEGEGWWWWFGQDPNTVLNNIGAHGTRLIDLSSYLDNGVRRYAAVELDDTNPTQAPINAESSRLQSFAESNGWAGGFHGSYFIQSASGASPIVAENSTFRFEPASAIKVLYLLYTLRQGVSLDSPITYYWTDNNVPTPTVCPMDAVQEIPANARTTTIRNALNGMMQFSNNVYTRAFAIRWGLGPVQAMANQLGLSGTHLNQAWIGCVFRGNARNELTLADAAKLYAAVDSGTALSGQARTDFFNILAGGPPSAGDAWGQVVSQEASALGKSAVVAQFLSTMNVRSKGGQYGICLADCNTYKLDLSVAGWVSIPFKRSGQITPVSYLFGDYVNDLVLTCSNCPAAMNANNLTGIEAPETARSTIRAALSTW
jgi:hypothetical protein